MEKINETTYKNLNEKFEVEIGDVKQPDFKQQLKLKRWDNECNFSCRLIEDETPFEIESVDGKIKCIKEKTEAHFYEIENGCEFEVVLKEKPKTNKVEFTIQSKDLNFYYQPELTNEELSEGIYRPENVIGSYAVYHKTKKNHQIGKQNYECGKAFHIYRPKIFDSDGKSVWGDLNIDEKQGILSVTIPKEFLDNAVYPVRHAAGLTFGYETAGATGNISMQNYVTGSVFTGAVGTGTSIHIYHNPSSTNLLTKAAIYTHSDLNLLTNGTTAVITDTTGAAWRTFNFATTPTLTAVEYILVGWGNSLAYTGNAIHADTGDTNQGHYDLHTYGAWPNPLVPSHDNNKYSIYCTYEGEAPAGWANKIFGIVPGKVHGIDVADIEKVQGVE